MDKHSFAIVDVETSGTSVSGDRIIEIGILRVEKGRVVRTFESLVNPGGPIPAFISAITGIQNRELESAPGFADIAKQVREMFSGCVFVAHNARFDYGFIKQEFRRNGEDFSARCLCTVRLSRLMYPRFRRHNLDAIMERCGLSCSSRHRAFADAEVVWGFLQMLSRTFTADKLESAIDTILKKTTLPPSIKSGKIDALPESCGVYVFLGIGGAPLYVGKSINVRDRVLSHFTAAISSSREMKIHAQIKDIAVYRTAGELGALLLESYMVKKLQPVYNRELRQHHGLVALRQGMDADGYYTAEIGSYDKLSSSEAQSFLGIFRSSRKAVEFLAETAKRYRLCPKLLGIEKSKDSCFAYHLGKCAGACMGIERMVAYNMRFAEAFEQRKIKSWPFSSPIRIRESDGDLQDAYIIDQWCLMGAVRFQDQARQQRVYEGYIFDYEAYKILTRWMRHPANRKKIRVVSRQEAAEILDLTDDFGL